MRELLRHRDFRLLFVGQALSMFGDWTLLLVFGIWAKTLTGSSAIAGLTIFAMAAPTLCTPLGAVVVDRVSRRRLIQLVSVASAAVVSTLWFVRGSGQLWLLFSVAVYYGLVNVIINAAVSALVQEMLPRDLVGVANGALATVRQGLRLVAPLVGAGLFAAVGGGWVATLDAVTFLGCGLAAFLIRFREGERIAPAGALRDEVAAGSRHIRGDAVLRRCALALAIGFGALGLTESAVFALVDEGLHQPPSFIGVLSSTQGIGAILAGTLVTAMIARRRPETVVLAGLVALTAGVALQSIPLFAGNLLGFGVVGASLPVLNVGLATLLQHRTPNALMGRVAVAFEVITTTPSTIMIAVSAVLVGVLPFRLLFVAAAVGVGISALLAIGPARSSVTTPARSAVDGCGRPADTVRIDRVGAAGGPIGSVS